MKFNVTIGSLLLATTTVVAQQDDPSDYPGNPGYRNIDWDFSGAGKIHLHEGSTYWRQNYPRNITADVVGCLNEDGRAVPVEGDNCATFYYVEPSGEDIFSEVLRTEKNNWLCAGREDSTWQCEEQQDVAFPSWIMSYIGEPPLFLSTFLPGTEGGTIFTWYIQHPPQSIADAQSLTLRNPNNPYVNETVLPGDPILPVLMEWVPVEH